MLDIHKLMLWTLYWFTGQHKLRKKIFQFPGIVLSGRTRWSDAWMSPQWRTRHSATKIGTTANSNNVSLCETPTNAPSAAFDGGRSFSEPGARTRTSRRKVLGVNGIIRQKNILCNCYSQPSFNQSTCFTCM